MFRKHVIKRRKNSIEHDGTLQNLVVLCRIEPKYVVSNELLMLLAGLGGSKQYIRTAVEGDRETLYTPSPRLERVYIRAVAQVPYILTSPQSLAPGL